MKKYFYSDGKEKHGPFSRDELMDKDIKNDTLIWFKGLEEWTPANDIDEMKPILELIPPPISKPIDQEPPPLVATFDKEPNVVNTTEVPQKRKSTESHSSQTGTTNQDMFSKLISFQKQKIASINLLFVSASMILLTVRIVFWGDLSFGETIETLAALIVLVGTGISVWGLIIGISELKKVKTTKSVIGIIGHIVVIILFLVLVFS